MLTRLAIEENEPRALSHKIGPNYISDAV